MDHDLLILKTPALNGRGFKSILLKFNF